MTDIDDIGLFFVAQLRTHDRLVNNAHCRVVEATVHSAQAPADHRLLTYKIGFWDHKPFNNEQCELFKCPVSGSETFVRKLPLTPTLTLEAVAQLALDHFLGLVLPNKPVRDTNTMLKSLFSINKAPWTYHDYERRRSYAVYDVQHHQHFSAHLGESLRHVFSTASFQGMIIKDGDSTVEFRKVKWDAFPRISFEHEYTTATDMVDKAGALLPTEPYWGLLESVAKLQLGV